MENRLKKIIFFLLLFFVFFNFYRSVNLFKFHLLFNHRFNFKEYEKKYFQSQWVIPESKNPIGDDVLYTYAGAKYLQGENPALINAEHPPLGKNLIGFFALFFGNEYYYSFLSGIFSLITFYFLANKFLKNKKLSFLLTLFFGFEPLFVVNYFLPVFDLLIFSFLNLYFLNIINFQEKNQFKHLFFAQIFLGLIISTKFLLISIPIIFSTILFFLIKDRKKIINYLLTLPIIFIILLINYFQFFLHQKNLVDFLKLQKYIYFFHTQGRKEHITLNFSLPLLLIKGLFYIDSKSKIVQESHYSFLWMVSFFGFFVFLFKNFLKINKNQLFLVIIWLIVYSFFISSTFINARYLILILPYLYLVLLFSFQ